MTGSSKTTQGVTLRSETPETYLHPHEGLQIIRGLRPEGTRVKKHKVMRKGLHCLHHVGLQPAAATGLNPEELFSYWDCVDTYVQLYVTGSASTFRGA